MELGASQGGIEGRENSGGRRRKEAREETTRAEAYASTATKRARRRRERDDVGRLLLVGDAEGPAGAAGRAGVGRVAGPLRGRVPVLIYILKFFHQLNYLP